MVVHTSNPNTQDAEAGGSLSARGQNGLHSEFREPELHSETVSNKEIKSDHYLPESLTGSMYRIPR